MKFLIHPLTRTVPTSSARNSVAFVSTTCVSGWDNEVLDPSAHADGTDLIRP